MNKRSTSPVVYWVSAAILLAISFSFLPTREIGSFFTGLCIAALLGYLGFRRLPKDRNKVKGPPIADAPESPVPPNICPGSLTAPHPPTSRTAHIPYSFGGFSRVYFYKDVNIFAVTPLPSIETGTELEIVLEDSNEHDPKAVALFAGSDKVGYIFKKGIFQGLIRDFIKRGEYALAFFNGPIEDGKASIALAFYGKTPHQKAQEKRKLIKTVKLTATAKSDRQEAISLCSVGDEIDYTYDDEKDIYIAECNGDEIGHFPKSANKLLDTYPLVFISEIELADDFEKYYVVVDLYD